LSLGFNYDFNALNGGSKQNELSEAFEVMFHSLRLTATSVLRILQAYVPALRFIVSAGRRKRS